MGLLICLVVLAVAGAVATAGFVAMMPYRLSYEKGVLYERVSWIRLCFVALGAVCGFGVIRLGTRKWERRLGYVCVWVMGAALLFGSPSGPHSIVSVKNFCINNLRQIDGAKEQWALERGKERGAEVNEMELRPYLKEGRIPRCPEGGAYIIGRVDEVPRCRVAGHTVF